VDTYLKGKNVSSYHRAGIDDVSILLSRTLADWAQTIQISARRFLLWTSLMEEPDGTASPPVPAERFPARFVVLPTW